MQLVSLMLKGHKRFEDETLINLSGNIVALIGPNEAGKSTILDALKHLTSDEPLRAIDRSRGYHGDHFIQAKYSLDDDDRQALSDIRGGDQVQLWMVTKWESDDEPDQTFSLSPEPTRDLAPRHDMHRELKSWAEHSAIAGLQTARGVNVPSLLEATLAVLTSDDESLSGSDAATLRNYADIVHQFSQIKEATRVGEEHELAGFLDLVSRLRAYDEGPSPAEQIHDRLDGLQPQVLNFTEFDRELHSTYNLNEVAGDPPGALRHLLDIAGIQLTEIFRFGQQGRRAEQLNALDQANDRLRELFRETWDQSKIVVRLNVQHPILEVMVRTPEGGNSMVDERSDGLRTFVALRAFIGSHHQEVRPILVVDEAETHLHYDAQANLVDLFTDQSLASKIVYSTHSIGCLPRDLGTGIRVIEPLDGNERSRVKASVWEDKSPGFRPLVVGLGAALFGFLPARNVLFGEGVTEAMLLPTLLREASGIQNLGYQVAPGIASVDSVLVGELAKQGGVVAFITDGDQDGRKYREDLEAAGVSKSHIFGLDELYGLDLSIEDLIDAESYLAAVARVVSENGFGGKLPALGDLPSEGRVGFLKQWCRRRHTPEPNKKRVVQALLDQKAQATLDGQKVAILDHMRTEKLKEWVGVLERIFA